MPSFIDNMTLIAVTYFTSIIAGDFRCIRESEIQAKETASKIEYEKEKNYRDLEKRVQELEIYDKQNDSDKQKDYNKQEHYNKKGSKQPNKKSTHPPKYSQGKAGNATPGGGNAASGGGNTASGSGNAASGGGSQISIT